MEQLKVSIESILNKSNDDKYVTKEELLQILDILCQIRPLGE